MKKIIIIGGGPSSLSFACSLKDTNAHITIIEKQSEAALGTPEYDGRDIALTHLSKSILSNLGVWEKFSDNEIASLKEAKVINGNSKFSLHFDHKKVSKNIDTLGYLVPNNVIRRELYKAVSTQRNVSVLTQSSVEYIKTTDNPNNKKACVQLNTGEILEADLLIAADGRFSTTRRDMGISASMKDFGRTIITCRIQHEYPHHNTAYECFHYGITLAILPFVNNESSIVITTNNNKAKELLDLDKEDFNQFLKVQLKGKLGVISRINKRHSYPLIGVYANQFITKRFALIGDAAVGMHPVTAHGFNLGLQGQHTLSSLIKTAIDHSKDISSPQLLKKYETIHQRVSRPIYLGTNAIVDLYTNDLLPAKIARATLLRISNYFPPIKNKITHQLTTL